MVFIALILLLQSCSNQTSKIDREVLVKRHNPIVTEADSLEVLSVGNGNFAFTADFTGLQTFTDFYEHGIPTCTQSYWGWHSTPGGEKYTLKDAMQYYDSHGRQVPYASKRGTPETEWLRANPHRLNLGRIGFILKKNDDAQVGIQDAQNIRQTLDLWNGLLKSYFEIEGQPVRVETAVHGKKDAVSARVKSPLLKAGQLQVVIEFPYGSENWGRDASDWTHPDRYKTQVIEKTENRLDLKCILDSETYYASIGWSGKGSMKKTAKHRFVFTPESVETFELSILFSKDPIHADIPTADETQHAAAAFWQKYWKSGGAIDLSQSRDPRAKELERRIVLSQYLVKVNSSGPFPPQETGLTCNSWYGKPHLEMHWWHAVQFVLWGRYETLEKTMPWYQSILPRAKWLAKLQGYSGARWPKMVGPDGREGPSSVGVFLIWQQPHPIYYAELFYRMHPDRETLEKYKELVFESAEFMASYAWWDESNQRYVLGPPLIPAQEKHPAATTMNPTFELAYWAWGLETAQKWRERLGLPRNEKWERVRTHLSPLPVKNGLYVNAETAMDTFGKGGRRVGHPSLLGAYGMLPGNVADAATMRRTLKKVMQTWNWESTWGWDFPLTAMTAARVGEPELAVDALLMDSGKNRYLLNGHNYQVKHLPLYLPGNGGLLTAVAMMAAGWDGAPDVHAPGFPQDGSWNVRWEGLQRMP
ncbi:MAG: glycoside hydrolase family 65 [Calditrichaeota bacterium]|nr:glycoside hydrolase family 65 [Calditrichota bacterium]